MDIMNPHDMPDCLILCGYNHNSCPSKNIAKNSEFFLNNFLNTFYVVKITLSKNEKKMKNEKKSRETSRKKKSGFVRWTQLLIK